MAKTKIQDIRNVVFCGHGGSGKTTMLDRLLVKTGAVNAHPSVDDGTSICDFDEEEKQHKYTIEASVTNFDHAGKHFNVIDTPGYPDFIGGVVGAMRGVDTAAITINAQSGIEVNTRRVFAEAEKAGLGRMVIINKMSRHFLPEGINIIESELIGRNLGGRESHAVSNVLLLLDLCEHVIKTVVRFKVLGFAVAADRLISLLGKTETVRFTQQNKKFFDAIIFSGNTSAHGVCPAGTGAVLIYSTASIGNKHAAGLAVIHHCQVIAGKDVCFILFNDDIISQQIC